MKNKGCFIAVGIVLLLATAALVGYFYQQREKGPGKAETEHPTIDDITEKTVATGTINPRQEVAIKPQVSGVIDQIYVEEGAMISKGQRLAKIKLIPSEVSINSAQSNVQLARLRYDESKRELERQKTVFQGSLDVDDAKLSYLNAKQEEERQAKLLEQGVISQQEYDRVKLDLDLRKTTYDNAKIVSENNLRQFEADVLIKKEELEAAINNLQLLREGVTKSSRQISNVITSTLDGMILDIPVKEGSSVIERNNFNEGTTIATIANMADLIFEGKVDESDVGKLKEGMPIKLTVGALGDVEVDALLEHISPKGEEEEGAIKFDVRASVTQTDSVLLRAGYSANGDIILNQKEGIVTINERDVIYQGDSTLVELQKDEDEFEKKLVDLGISDGIRVEVVSGLDTSQAIKKQVLEEDD